MATAVEKEYIGSIVFLNMIGDVSIYFDENNREAVLDMVRKKMKEGYTFFLLQ